MRKFGLDGFMMRVHGHRWVASEGEKGINQANFPFSDGWDFVVFEQVVSFSQDDVGENSLENIHEEAYLDYGRSLVDSRNVGTEIEGVSSEKKGS